MSKRYNLAHVLARMNGAAIIGIDTATIPSLLGGRKNPMLNNVTKHHKGAQVMLYQNKHVNGYQAAVQRRLVQEGKDPGSFTLGERTFGTRIPETPIIAHERDGVTELYLECIFMRPGVSTYTYMGNPIDESDIQGLKPAQSGGEQGGLDDKVVIRTFKLSSITAIRFNKEEYVGEFYYNEDEPVPDDLSAVNLANVSAVATVGQQLRDISKLIAQSAPSTPEPELTPEQMDGIFTAISELTTIAKTVKLALPPLNNENE